MAKKAGIAGCDAYQNNPGLLLSELLDNAVKKIGFEAPVLIKKWPSSMTTSAELSAENRHWTTRTEIIIAGIEIADGFPFLCDYAVQKAQFERANALRHREKLSQVALDQRYLEMMPVWPWELIDFVCSVPTRRRSRMFCVFLGMNCSNASCKVAKLQSGRVTLQLCHFATCIFTLT